jgi:hypothetical protein
MTMTFVLVVLFLAVIIRNSNPTGMFWMVAWPGTVIHEGCHWIVGTVLQAKPTKFHVLPDERENSVVLGYVHFDNLTWWNTLPTAMAPLLALPVAYYMAPQFGPLSWTWMGVFKIWVLASIVASAIPSKGDIGAALGEPKGLVLWGTLAFLVLK